MIDDSKRLADLVLERDKTTSQFIERQFPAIYRENGRELIELVKAYYQFLEQHNAQSVYNIRRIYEYRNIDSTLDRMVVFFKNKFLNGLFFEEDTRFIVKHILDLYRRKGSKEGIELFFKLFFESEVDVYFPSQDIFKPSTSLWKTGSFIQLYSTTDFTIFQQAINKKIYGDKSNAEAFVDNVYFVKVENSYIPLIFISDVKGEFMGFDIIYSLEPFTSYGRIYGSLQSVEINDRRPGSGDNKVGDLVDIKSDIGYGAKGRISRVSQDLTGEIIFEIEDGSYGYTLENTDILISDQNIFLDDEKGFTFFINERIRQERSGVEISGTVIGRQSDSIGIYLDYTGLDQQILFLDNAGLDFTSNEEIMQENSFGKEVFGTVISQSQDSITVQIDKSKPDSESERYFFEVFRDISTTQRVENITKEVTFVDDNYFFDNSTNIETTGREVNITEQPLFVTEKNSSARAEINSIKNEETITIISDLIESYLDVSIDSNNYSETPPALIEMSGTRADPSVIPNLNTPLSEAFVPETFTIGEIETLSDINPGRNHMSDVFVLARENNLSRFNLQDQILNITVPSGVLLFENDIILQQKDVINFEGNIETKEVKGRIVSVSGNNITVKQLTFESFITSESIFKEGNTIPITVNSRSRDIFSAPLGTNAVIRGDVETVKGKIQEIEIISSGIAYEDESEVEINNTSKIDNEENIDAFGVAKARGQGVTEGRWQNFISNINQEKVIQDSFFYQDYSYEITIAVEPRSYEDEYKSLMHPSGMKLFTKFGKISVINTDIDLFNSFIIFDDEIVEEPNSMIISGNGFPYLDLT